MIDVYDKIYKLGSLTRAQKKYIYSLKNKTLQKMIY